MLFLIWFSICLVVVAFLALLAAFWGRDILNRYSGSRPVTCPENQQSVVVEIDARHAVASVMDGQSNLRLCDCTRWPERAKCNQACLSQAVQAEPYTPGRPKGTKQIYHLPIALAALAAWLIGVFWHSQWMFRLRWMDAAGLTRAQVKQMVWWVSPHLVIAAAWLLFAYGVAWLLAVSHRKGVLPGVLMAVALSAAVVAMSWYAIARMPHDLFVIEAGYTVLAALIVGAIVGGLFDRLVLRSQ